MDDLDDVKPTTRQLRIALGLYAMQSAVLGGCFATGAAIIIGFVWPQAMPIVFLLDTEGYSWIAMPYSAWQ